MAKVIELRNSNIKQKRETLTIVFVVAGFIYFYYYAKKRNADIFIHSMVGIVVGALVGVIASRLLYPYPTTKKDTDSKKFKIIKLNKDESKSEQQDLSKQEKTIDVNREEGDNTSEDKDIDKILSEA